MKLKPPSAPVFVTLLAYMAILFNSTPIWAETAPNGVSTNGITVNSLAANTLLRESAERNVLRFNGTDPYTLWNPVLRTLATRPIAQQINTGAACDSDGLKLGLGGCP